VRGKVSRAPEHITPKCAIVHKDYFELKAIKNRFTKVSLPSPFPLKRFFLRKLLSLYQEEEDMLVIRDGSQCQHESTNKPS
jgi:hypothetical protein